LIGPLPSLPSSFLPSFLPWQHPFLPSWHAILSFFPFIPSFHPFLSFIPPFHSSLPFVPSFLPSCTNEGLGCKRGAGVGKEGK
jgi:hypothetical protein